MIDKKRKGLGGFLGGILKSVLGVLGFSIFKSLPGLIRVGAMIKTIAVPFTALVGVAFLTLRTIVNVGRKISTETRGLDPKKINRDAVDKGINNFSTQLVRAAQAFAAGNRIMLKPSEITPKTSSLTKKMFNEFFDKTEIEVFLGGPDVAEAFGKLKFDHLLFTGSTSNGQKVMESASKSLVPITLELGGKSPVIMDETCDLATSATRIMRGKTVNAGQICIAPDYMMMPKGKVEDFINESEKAVGYMFPDIKYNENLSLIHI